MIWQRGFCRLVLVLLALPGFTRGDTPGFDLSGPRIDVRVTRRGKSLPISQVPNLQPGDRLWLHPEIPQGQSVHYLLIAAFLRGSTNPPPESWFTKVETWSKRTREEGVIVTVPEDAQQALLFYAPETGGGFGTLRSAVRGRPGSFVRASQDLDRASLDRTRLDKYLNTVKATSDSDPQDLRDRSLLLARSLNIRLDQRCFDKPSQEQTPCLVQNTDQLVLDDAHSQTMVAALTSGPSVDLIGAVSSTPMARSGYYSAYIGAVVDVARLMNNFHSAEYQYIPALALPRHDELNLKLNNPPSFRNPKSVLVIALPAVEAAQLPPLRAVDPDQLFCLERPPLVLPVEGAPLAFSTELAHDFALHLKSKTGEVIDLPARADAARGGFVIDLHTLEGHKLDPELEGTLRGFWGFEPLVGPAFHLRSAHRSKWAIPTADQSALIVGRHDILHLRAENACCVEQITLNNGPEKQVKIDWKLLKPEELEVQVPLQTARAGQVAMLVKQFGLAEPDEVLLQTYSEAARLDEFVLHSGDHQGALRGTRLDEVTGIELKGIHFVPAGLSRADQKDELRLSAPDATSAVLPSGDKLAAHVSLKDGRVLNLDTKIEPPRPKLNLISKTIQPGPSSASAIHLGNEDQLPQDARLSFVLKTEVPAAFPRTEKIEVASEDESFDVLLSLTDGTLTLQDAQTVLAALDPAKSFGASAFGPLRFRPVDANGAKGDWQPLAHLVRLPSLKEVRCPDSPDRQCTLSGTNLFLIDSIASDSQFTHAVPVPVGFAGSDLGVPRPNGTLLYLKLRDDPSAVSKAVLPVLPERQ
jgi:hypothetical protein